MDQDTDWASAQVAADNAREEYEAGEIGLDELVTAEAEEAAAWAATHPNEGE